MKSKKWEPQQLVRMRMMWVRREKKTESGKGKSELIHYSNQWGDWKEKKSDCEVKNIQERKEKSWKKKRKKR